MNYKYIRTLPTMESYINTLEYLLSHAGFKERKKSIGYYGCLSAGSRDSKQIMANQNDIVNTPILDLPDVEKSGGNMATALLAYKYNISIQSAMQKTSMILHIMKERRFWQPTKGVR